MLILTADAAIELANWDSSKVRDKLRRDIDAHVASVRAAKLSDLIAHYEVCLARNILSCVMFSQTDISTLDIYVFGFMNYAYNIIPVMNKLRVNMGFKILIIWLIYLQKQLNVALLEPVEALIDAAGDDTWPAIKNLLQRETVPAISGLSSSLSGFDLDQKTLDKILASLSDYARNVVEMKAKEEAGRVLIRMKDR